MSKKDMYVKEETKEVVEKEVKAKVGTEKKKTPPPTYKAVNFTTLGKLDAPKTLHFRDYSMDEVQEIAFSSQESNLATLIDCLNNMVWEDFDCAKFHPKELIEAIFTIQGEYYTSKITKDYYIDDKLPEDELNKKENIISQEILLSSLDFETMPSEVLEPIRLSDPISQVNVTSRFQRIQDVLDMMNYLTKDKFHIQELQYRPILSKYSRLSQEDKYDNEEGQYLLEKDMIDMYGEDDFNKAIDFQKTLIMHLAKVNALTIQSINDTDCTGLCVKEKLDMLPTIPNSIWEKYNEIVKNYPFGLNEDVTFYSTHHGKKITRRLPFQYSEFLPNNNTKGNERITVQFG